MMQISSSIFLKQEKTHFNGKMSHSALFAYIKVNNQGHNSTHIHHNNAS